MISYIALGVAVVALAGVAYILFVVLPKMGKGMKELGKGLEEVGGGLAELGKFADKIKTNFGL